MGNPDHLRELLKGVEQWNAWRAAQGEDFRPDFQGIDLRQTFLAAGLRIELDGIDFSNANLAQTDLEGASLMMADFSGADLSSAILEGANLDRATLRHTNLSFSVLWRAQLIGANLLSATCIRADFRGADMESVDLTSADLRGAILQRADLENAVVGMTDARTFGAHGKVWFCDLSTAKYLTQDMVDAMIGDEDTRLPDGIIRPPHWEESNGHADDHENPKAPSPVGFTAPVEFETEGAVIDVRHLPTRPEARRASNTPIDMARCAEVRAGLVDSFGALAKNLRKYAKEDRNISNRVGPAEALLGYVESLQRALRADPFLPSTFNDYVEIIALGAAEDIQAFEAGDRVAVQQLVTRSRRHYACYPELAEMNDPAHADRIGDDFPFTVATMEATLDEIVYSEDGLQFFTDATRETIEAEKIAYPPANADPDKSKLARYGAIIGEMSREMGRRAESMRKAADAGAGRAIAWVKSYEKVRKAWEAIEPWLGIGGGGSG